VTDIVAQPTYLDVHLPEGKRFTQPIPRGHAAFAYLYEGDASFGKEDVRVQGPRLVVFKDGDAVTAQPIGGPARVPAGLGRADQGTDRALRAVRHEHARGDPPDARGAARRPVRRHGGRAVIGFRVCGWPRRATLRPSPRSTRPPCSSGRLRSSSFPRQPRRWRAARRVAPSFPWLVAERAGDVNRYAYGSRHKERDAYAWSVDVSAYVRADCHARGSGAGSTPRCSHCWRSRATGGHGRA
jgi:hypothetical protein